MPSLASSFAKFRRHLIQASLADDLIALDQSIEAQAWPQQLKDTAHEDIAHDLAPLVYRTLYELSEAHQLPRSSPFYDFHLQPASDLMDSDSESESEPDAVDSPEIEDLVFEDKPLSVEYIKAHRERVLFCIFASIFSDNAPFVLKAYNTPLAMIPQVVKQEFEDNRVSPPVATDSFSLTTLLAIPGFLTHLLKVEARLRAPEQHLQSISSSPVFFDYYKSINASRDQDEAELIATSLDEEEQLPEEELAALDTEFHIHIHVLMALAGHESERSTRQEARSMGISAQDLYSINVTLDDATGPDLLSSMAHSVHQCTPIIDEALSKPLGPDEFYELTRHIRNATQENFSSAMAITDLISP